MATSERHPTADRSVHSERSGWLHGRLPQQAAFLLQLEPMRRQSTLSTPSRAPVSYALRLLDARNSGISGQRWRWCVSDEVKAVRELQPKRLQAPPTFSARGRW